jgi:hypothetical protein
MDCNIYGRTTGNNPAVSQKLLSGDMANVLREAGALVGGIYSSIVARRSNRLAESVEVDPPVIGGEKNDRLVIDVVSGRGTPRGGYGASHEFGIGIHDDSQVPPTPWMPQDPADDWVKSLAIMDSLP